MSARTAAGPKTGGRWRMLTDPAVLNLIAATAAVGVAGAFVVPTTSLFLSEAVTATPLMVGLFFAVRSVAEIGTDIVVGAVSDRLRNRRTILVLTALFNACGALCYTFLRDYYLLLLSGMVCFGLGGACFGQLFAYTRELADARGVDAPFFNGFLRSVTSLAWVVGPPLAFWTIATWSFTALYASTAALSLLAAALCGWGLPDPKASGAAKALPAKALPEKALPEKAGPEGSAAVATPEPAEDRPPGMLGMFRGLGRRTALVLGAVVLLLGANAMYQINLPLYVTEDLGMSPQFAGLLLGVSAFVEIPLMVLAGVWAERVGKQWLMFAATVCATLFFVLLPLADTRPFLLALQPLNAAWAAVALNIPVVMLQDSLPGRIGTASALYSSAFKAGMFLGGLVVGTVATWTGYGQVFWVCAGLTAVAGVLALLLRTAPEVPSPVPASTPTPTR
ncbi:sugar efflux transporter [Streptomyces griseoviridis]|uniref:SET family sugar efflux transporter-like MFS transporter n=1 Tax=Streptomyces griseoviridis TaxID=45398 RepID=A0ABT9LE27_STRGD|nr:sugar efflux transporter [Streptomyces griseoviridis]MDP9681970.1 SET family sugar efflux transporter-like MFS transporter [Streptomyces griseoviridis]GGT03478.1 sugar efflux transporter SetB [Streptomyces griseoviridis]